MIINNNYLKSIVKESVHTVLRLLKEETNINKKIQEICANNGILMYPNEARNGYKYEFNYKNLVSLTLLSPVPGIEYWKYIIRFPAWSQKPPINGFLDNKVETHSENGVRVTYDIETRLSTIIERDVVEVGNNLEAEKMSKKEKRKLKKTGQTHDENIVKPIENALISIINMYNQE